MTPCFVLPVKKGSIRIYATEPLFFKFPVTACSPNQK